MDMELDRRSFLIVLGVAAAATAGARARPLGGRLRPAIAPPRCFFATALSEPAGRPRSSAITYVPLSCPTQIE